MESDPKSIDSMSYTELTKRKESVNKRLSEIILPTFSQNSKDRKKNANSGTKDSSFSNKDKTSNSKKVKEEHQVYKIPSKTDVHWDFLMKEMMWLAADFQSERKRQISSGKKLAGAVKQFHNTKEVRRLRELAEAEAKRRRLAAKLARDVKTWWTKIEKIISFKQKLQLDQLRQKQMDKHLVYLVKQTERYSQKLNEQLFNSHSDQNSKPSIPSPSKNTRSKRINRYKLHSTQTIEHALSVSPSPSNSKSKGEKSDSPKKSFTVSNDVAARTLEYDTRQANDDMTSSATRYRTRKTRISSSRRVTFAPNLADEVDNDDKFNTKSNFINIKELFLDNNNDVADGDADISDDSLDFENDENDLVDDETTIEAEEKLGREMSVEEELELLKKEAELSVDEVWANIAPHLQEIKKTKTMLSKMIPAHTQVEKLQMHC